MNNNVVIFARPEKKGQDHSENIVANISFQLQSDEMCI